MQAMLTARMFPESEKGGRGKKTEARNLAETAKFSYRRLNEARAVLRHSPDLADAVIKGDAAALSLKACKNKKFCRRGGMRLKGRGVSRN
jgi:hypothetical protein